MSFNLANVTEALQGVEDDNLGITFAGLAKKWESENDGKQINVFSFLQDICILLLCLQLKKWLKRSMAVSISAILTLKATHSAVKPRNTSARR